MKISDFKILIGCEFSDTVRSMFEKRGFNAVSCDILPNNNPDAKHIQGDILTAINSENWNALIAFPPCTHLAASGAAWFEQKRKNGQQQKSIDFFLNIANCNIKHIAIENPVGIMGKLYRKPDQIIQPFYFGDMFQKTTCLWLKNFPKLIHIKTPDLFNDTVTHVDKGEFYYLVSKKTNKLKRQPLWFVKASGKDRGKKRSVFWPGIAAAMAEQWGNYFIEKYSLTQ
jgi:hypothetical protein